MYYIDYDPYAATDAQQQVIEECEAFKTAAIALQIEWESECLEDMSAATIESIRTQTQTLLNEVLDYESSNETEITDLSDVISKLRDILEGEIAP